MVERIPADQRSTTNDVTDESSGEDVEAKRKMVLNLIAKAFWEYAANKGIWATRISEIFSGKIRGRIG